MKRIFATRINATRAKATAVFAGVGPVDVSYYYLRPFKGTFARLSKLPVQV